LNAKVAVNANVRIQLNPADAMKCELDKMHKRDAELPESNQEFFAPIAPIEATPPKPEPGVIDGEEVDCNGEPDKDVVNRL
jgi:hypothetical protein